MEKKVQWSETLVKSNSATHRASWKHSQHRRSSIDYATLLKKGMARVWERMVDLISSILQVAKGASTWWHRWAIVSPRNPRASPDAWRSGVLKEITLKTSVLITSHFSCKITWNHHNPPTNHSQIIASVHTKPRLNEKKKILGPTKGSSRRLGKVPWAGRRRKCRKAPGVTPLEEGAGWHLGTFLRLAICFSPKWLGGGSESHRFDQSSATWKHRSSFAESRSTSQQNTAPHFHFTFNRFVQKSSAVSGCLVKNIWCLIPNPPYYFDQNVDSFPITEPPDGSSGSDSSQRFIFLHADRPL